MPFPADPGKDSQFHWSRWQWNWFTLQLGIGLLLTLRQSNLRGWDDHSSRDRAVTHAGRKELEEPAVGSLPAAFCENFEQFGISAIIEARREGPAAYPRARVALLVFAGQGARTSRVRNKFGQAPRAI